MAKQVTQYSVLLSCPSDIVDEIEVVNKTVENFNRLFGDANNIDLKIKHWSTHSFPESGGKPQELLNEQIVRDSDAAIAIFWTRFGTPTDEYGSGTEEEIEELIRMGKQVFVYFSDRSLSPSEYNPKELERVKDFKIKYKDRGIYWGYKDIEEFRRLLTNHVSMYFMKQLSNVDVMTKDEVINLKLCCFDGDTVSDYINMSNKSFLESQYCIEAKENITKIFDDIKVIKVPKRIEAKPKNTHYDTNIALSRVTEQIQRLSINSNQFDNLSHFKEISPTVVECISEYYESHYESTLIDEFFELGNLKSTITMFGGGVLGTSPSTTISGTEEEKNKYDSIMKLYGMIIEYSDAVDYFGYLDSLFWFSGVISNVGTRYDEDIDISIFIEKGCLVNPKNLKLSGNSFIEMINSNFEYIFRPKKTWRVEEYSDYPIRPAIPNSNLPIGLLGKSLAEEIEECQLNYQECIEDTFVYEVFEEDVYDVIKFNIGYIKHSSNINFPSFLLFQKIPSKLPYKIVSKHSSKTIEGEIKRK